MRLAREWWAFVEGARLVTWEDGAGCGSQSSESESSQGSMTAINICCEIIEYSLNLVQPQAGSGVEVR